MLLNLPSPLHVLLSPGISHSRHSHMQKGCQGRRETQEREEPVLETWKGFRGMQHPQGWWWGRCWKSYSKEEAKGLSMLPTECLSDCLTASETSFPKRWNWGSDNPTFTPTLKGVLWCLTLTLTLTHYSQSYLHHLLNVQPSPTHGWLFCLTLTSCLGQIWLALTCDSCKNTSNIFYPEI